MPTFPQPCSYSVLTTTRTNGPTLTPTVDQADARAKLLATCEELTELGMDLARAAHREALRDMQPPLEQPKIPGLTSYSDPPERPAPRQTAFAYLFTAISRCVRQTVLLQARLMDGAANPRPEHATRDEHAPKPTTVPQPGDHTRIEADRLRPEILEDETRTADTRPAPKILADIRAKLDSAMQAGLTPSPPKPAPQNYRRPIPIIPPGPKRPLTGAERSAVMYHLQMNPERNKPDG